MSGVTQRMGSLEAQRFETWPPVLRALFDGTGIASKTGFTASLMTADEQGRIRTSLLSVGELFACDERRLCFSLWPQSRAALALAKQGRATLSCVADETFYQIQLTVGPLAPAPGDAATLACFVASIEAGEGQRVPYARLTGGIAFELADEGAAAVLERWQRQIDALKRAAFAAQLV